MGMDNHYEGVHYTSLRRASKIAERLHCFNAIITGKGEPTLFSASLRKAIFFLREMGFPVIELQTNGIRLVDKTCGLSSWSEEGLGWVSISLVSWDDEVNTSIMQPKVERPSTASMVAAAKKAGLRVRLSCIMTKGAVDDWQGVRRMREFATEIGADHLTVRPVNMPSVLDAEANAEKAQWVRDHKVPEQNMVQIQQYLESKAGSARVLSHGAKVYSVQLGPGQREENICLTNCFVSEEARLADKDTIRQLIVFPDGTVTTDWDHPGNTIL
jgi:molybdenum cofactor biosynthesis enzyme MoaA